MYFKRSPDQISWHHKHSDTTDASLLVKIGTYIRPTEAVLFFALKGFKLSRHQRRGPFLAKTGQTVIKVSLVTYRNKVQSRTSLCSKHISFLLKLLLFRRIFSGLIMKPFNSSNFLSTLFHVVCCVHKRIIKVCLLKDRQTFRFLNWKKDKEMSSLERKL